MCTILSNQALRKRDICLLEIKIAYLDNKKIRILEMFRKLKTKNFRKYSGKISVLETLEVLGCEDPVASRNK